MQLASGIHRQDSSKSPAPDMLRDGMRDTTWQPVRRLTAWPAASTNQRPETREWTKRGLRLHPYLPLH